MTPYDGDLDQDRRRIIGLWLLGLCAMVFVMVVLGGVTRLTHSGLSMASWKPVTGWLPPMSEGAWQVMFDLYRQTPEFREVNSDMTVGGFKSIFWLEFLHRLWGRIIGVVFFLPFMFFILRGWVKGELVGKLAMTFVLGGLQGVLGWYMVKSGLVDQPDVSQYRLTAHLGAAVIIYAYMFWTALGLLFPLAGGAAETARAGKVAGWLAGFVFVVLLSGGFVAGLDAGFAHNTFPDMDGEWIPDNLFELSPWYLNLFENITTVQFDHRVLAESLFVGIVGFWFYARRLNLSNRQRVAVHHLAGMAVVQVALGISTLVLFIPVPLAAAHQAGAVLLLTTALWTAFELRRGNG